MTGLVLLHDSGTLPRDGPPPPCLPPLLRLPPAIRHKIYCHVGLAPPDGKPREFDLGENRAGSSIPKMWSGWRGFHGLLLVCRLIHDEAADLLYSSNRFSLYYCWTTGPTSLDPLLALTPPALAALRELKIVLNQAGCHKPDREDRFAQGCCTSSSKVRDACPSSMCGPTVHHAPLLGSGPEDLHPAPVEMGFHAVEAHASSDRDAMLAAWHAAAEVLSHTTPGRLELSLVCDVDARDPWTVQLARSVVEPLRTLPRSHLRCCHLRLSMRPDRRLQRMARDTVLHVSDMTPKAADAGDGVAWLMRLPAEVRIRILEHTDLVTPAGEVHWTHDDGPRRYSAGSIYYGKRSACWRQKPRHGCFCLARHAAFSPACRCWHPPTPTLFLLCRALTRDAYFVFFSRNHFVIDDFSRVRPWTLGVLGNSATVNGGVASPYAHQRLAASEFLRGAVPPAALPYLRSLELSFRDSLPPNWPGTEHPAMQDWRETVEWLRGRVSAPSLELQLHAWYVGLETGHASCSLEFPPDEAKPVLQAYDDIARPLRALVDDGMTKFEARLQYPWPLPGRRGHPTPGTRGYYNMQAAGREGVNERAEQLVLGDLYKRSAQRNLLLRNGRY